MTTDGVVAVAGATGYIGTRLVPRLLSAGRRVRCLVRSPRKLDDRPWAADPKVEIVSADLDDVEQLVSALTGCEVLFYLVHSMRSALNAYADQDRRLAKTVADAASRAGVRRIIYLGGLGDDRAQLSDHLASRREVESLLGGGRASVTTLRAAMIIGSGSASFEILRYLTERLPVMLTPRWVQTRCQPIAVRNVLHYLVACLATPETEGRTLEVGGPDVVTYEQLIQILAAARGLPPRRIVRVPFFTPWLSSLWIHVVTPVDAAIARPLAQGLRNPVVVSDDTALRLMPQRLLGVRESIVLALAAEARGDVESVWTAAGPMPGDPDWAGGRVFEDRRERYVGASPDAVFAAVTTLGGAQGWYGHRRLWATRGLLDRIVGGPGGQRPRRHPTRLAWGDSVGFWRVAGIEAPRRLALRAEMRLPGDAVLEFAIEPARGPDGGAGSKLVQWARFRPRGVAGLVYWMAVTPFHSLVFASLLDGIAAAAGRAPSPAAAAAVADGPVPKVR